MGGESLGKIKILDESVSNIIAAGEVVENPASMIKELLENSLDAESKSIRIEIKNGGRDVAIIDDGVGMSQDDLLLSIERHATSKISKKDDLYNLYTYGFRGEALSSISAVSKMSISSRVEESEVGSQITVLGGKVTSLKDVQRNRGTTIEIKELFFNTPARLKFLRKPSTEYINIKDIIIQEALSNPDVAIMLILDGKVSIKTSGNGLDNAIVEIFGKNVLKNMKKFKLGYLGNGAIYRSTKDSIFTFVNNRMVKSKIVESAVIDGYYTKLMKGKYPFAIIFLDINPKDVDVNVHPSKKIVKFADEEEVYNYVLKEIEKTFARDDDFVSPTLQEKIEKEESKFLDFSEFEKFTPMKSEPQQFQELLEEEKDIEEEIFGEKREKLQEKDILREEFEEKKEYEVIEDKRIEKEIIREENIEFNTEPSSKNKIPLDIYEEKVKTPEITVKKVEEKVLLLFHKPRGVVCSTKKQRQETTVTEYLNYPVRIYPIGRLDKESEGLLLLTNQGDLVNKIMRAGNYHEKEYEVTVDKKITETFIRKMSSGVPILGTVTRPCTVYKTGDKSFSIILTQGLNRQIRRMCEYLGYHVCTLKRIRIMNLTLDGLKCGEYREICGDEWKKLNELIRDSSSETVIRTGGQHGNISGRTNKRTGAEAERSGKGILSGRPGDHEQQRVRRTVRSTGKNGKGNRNRSGRQPNC